MRARQTRAKSAQPSEQWLGGGRLAAGDVAMSRRASTRSMASEGHGIGVEPPDK